MKLTADVADGDQVRQPIALGGLDLSAVFPQLRRNPGQTQKSIKFGLRGEEALLARPGPSPGRAVARGRGAVARGRGAVARGREAVARGREAVFVETPPLALGQLAERDVVFLAASEVLERRAPVAGLHHTQIHLEPVAQDHARLRLAGGGDVGHLGQAAEGRHDHGRLRADAQDVHVADGVAPAAQAAGGLDASDGPRRHSLQQAVDHGEGQGPHEAEGRALVAAPRQEVDPLEDFLLAFGAEALQIA